MELVERDGGGESGGGALGGGTSPLPFAGYTESPVPRRWRERVPTASQAMPR